MRKGFSLVELSIVLVILGLLVGGVLSGQSLIRAAELRAITTEYQRYMTASKSFRDKYFALPGDMNNATAFWGTMGGAGCTNSSGTAVTTPGTCDGNADGYLAQSGAIYQSGEVYQFWRQLAFAGLIEGKYSGIIMNPPSYNQSDYTGTDGSGASNSPSSRLNNARWGNLVVDNTGGAAVGQLFNVDYRNWFWLFTASAYPGNIIKPSEAWNVDTKMDDGMPARGAVQIAVWQDCTTATGGTGGGSNLNATYVVSNDALLCSMLFKQ